MTLRTTLTLVLLLAFPLLVALLDLSVFSTLILMLLVAAGLWASVMRRFTASPGADELVLETIGISHFAEKVRWPMDRLGIRYRERICAGTLGAFYWGRTVPVLEFQTGRVISTIGNSGEILRYLWGAYGQGPQAAFLEPTPRRVEFEERLDRYGQNLQVWAYYHLLERKSLMLELWGAYDPRVPGWQRTLVRWLYPVQVALMRRAFRLSTGHYESAKRHIEALLADVDRALAESPRSILGDEDPNYTDFAFAALSTPWALPGNFAGREQPVLTYDKSPASMQEDIDEFRQGAPAAWEYVISLYRDERGTPGEAP